MSESSIGSGESARKIERVVLHALASTGQSVAASSMGVSESTVSRLKEGSIAQVANLLSALGLKVVPASYKCMDPVRAQAMATLYEAAMTKVNAVELLWGDEDAKT